MIAILLTAALIAAARPKTSAPERSYLVVLESGLDAGYAKAADALAKAHRAKVESWTGDFAALEKLLLESKPQYLALVLSPKAIDANLPRRLVPVLTRFDDDPFVDCAFGLITGATGDDARKFVDNILAASKKDLPERFFSATSVVVDQCAAIGPSKSAELTARELERTQLWVTGKDPKWRDFLARERDGAEKRGLIEWGHCGDSQGIWLFSMFRNRERDKHWPWDPAKVGFDPKGEMPRMGALDLLDRVDLAPAVVVNGSCHSAVTCNTIVAGDIVSTFGDTKGVVRFFAISPEDSFPLMAIRHGASAYIGPLAANNANRAAIEQWWIETGGVPLGEVMKRTYDELVLGDADRKLEFGLYEDGKPEPRETPMFDDTVHRVRFGDPAFVVWRKPAATSHELAREPRERGLRVEMHWTGLKSDPWVWDPWRERRAGEELGRMYERIALDGVAGGVPDVTVVSATAERGKESKPIALSAFAMLERGLDGEPILHVKAQGARTDMDARGMPNGPDALRAVLEIRFAAPSTPGR